MSWRIIVIGIALYACLSALPVTLMLIDAEIHSLFKTDISGRLQEWIGYLMWFIPGYLAGRHAKKRGMAHGAIIGGVGAICSMLLSSMYFSLGFASPLVDYIHWSLTSAFFCALAASLGEFHAYKRKQL